MPKLSVVVICYNEEGVIGKSLSSVQWADEIIVVDSYSTDGTLEIVRQFTHRAYQHTWEGYGKQKNRALTYASCPWVLSLDADEVVSPELGREIRDLLKKEPAETAFWIPRMTFYLGRFLRHAWHPDRKLRLFLKDHVKWGEEAVHERIHLNGPCGRRGHPLLHYSFESILDHLQTIQRYTTLGAEGLFREGRTFSLLRLLGSPIGMFLKQYLLKRGFLDGIPGLVACVLSGVHEFVKYAKLYELQKGRQTLAHGGEA